MLYLIKKVGTKISIHMKNAYFKGIFKWLSGIKFSILYLMFCVYLHYDTVNIPHAIFCQELCLVSLSQSYEARNYLGTSFLYPQCSYYR
jgi:hypothetical protein